MMVVREYDGGGGDDGSWKGEGGAAAAAEWRRGGRAAVAAGGQQCMSWKTREFTRRKVGREFKGRRDAEGDEEEEEDEEGGEWEFCGKSSWYERRRRATELVVGVQSNVEENEVGDE
ncbi:unnamed protein product [Calypogeia fissa]